MAESAHLRFACQSQPRGGAMQSNPNMSNLTEAHHLAHKESKQPQQNITLNTISFCYFLVLIKSSSFLIDIVPIPAATFGEHRRDTQKKNTKRSFSRVSNERREKHNLKERERRWPVILSYCQ